MMSSAMNYGNERTITSGKKNALEPTRSSNIEVLIFDDDIDATKLLNEALGAVTTSGKPWFFVKSAKTLQFALKKISKQAPDLQRSAILTH